MSAKWTWCLVVLMAVCLVVDVAAEGYSSDSLKVKKEKGEKVCTRGWECKSWSKFCCNHTISDYFQVYQFENLFSKRNLPIAHATYFWDYQSFIVASADYQHLGFGTTGNQTMGQTEVAAFLGHVGSRTSCGNMVSTGGPYAWGLCYNKELSPGQSYCDKTYQYTYPCTPGVEYYGRGAIPIFWNYNYGAAGEALKVNLLDRPDLIEQNATLAFQAAIWKWMTPIKKGQPSPHDAFVGNWKPTKNDTLSKRMPGFGATMNLLYGDYTCGQGDNDNMSNVMSHYLYYLDLLGVGRDEAGPSEALTCAEQKPFNPSGAKSASS